VFVLVHSPLVGPATWELVAAELSRRGHQVLVPRLPDLNRAALPRWRVCADAVRAAIERAGPAEVLLVGHSGAGQLLPAIGVSGQLDVRAYVFVDAALPGAGSAPVVPQWLRRRLDDLAVDGQLPPWSEWWGPEAMATLVPDAKLRATIEAELPRLPLAYFDEKIDVPDNWPSQRGAYLQLSAIFAEDASAAEARGWPVERMTATHLHMVVDPVGVTGRILELTRRVATGERRPR
jgi:pimeloyl-ACP methyl ester carboxylesterase